MDIRYFVTLTATLLVTAAATILILHYAGCPFCIEQGLAQSNSEEEQ
jgi:hypothetical protein